MNFKNQEFIKEFKTLIDKEKKSNKIIKGKIITIHHDMLEISTKYSVNLNKDMQIEVNRVKAQVLQCRNKNIKVSVENNSNFNINQEVSIQNIQKDIIIHKLQETYDAIIENKLNQDNINTLNLLFGDESCGYDNTSFHMKNLNENQIEAVKKSLQSRKFHLIQGPPGTGKTHTIIEIIRQLYNKGNKILITTHTHIALDNIIERLTSIDDKDVLRVGSPDKISSEAIKYSMSSHIKCHDNYHLVLEKRELLKRFSEGSDAFVVDSSGSCGNNFISRVFGYIFGIDNNDLNKGKNCVKSGCVDNSDRINELKAEISHIEKNIQSDVLSNIKIFASTVLSSSGYLTKDLEFDYVIMDEASQVPVYLALIPLMKTSKFILIGDNKQLQPIQNNNSPYILNKSVFNLLIEKYPENYTFLNIQYRMNEQISDIASKLYYDNKLFTGENVRNQRIKLKNHNNFLLDDDPITVFDTSNVDFNESNVSGGCCNKYESYLVIHYLNALQENGILLDDVGIITPYRKQKVFINKLLNRNGLVVECDTIYRFQGREKDVIIVSFCKSLNKSLSSFQEHFLGNENQLNVSITRSRKKLVLIGNFDMIRSAVNIDNLLNEISPEDIVYLEDVIL